MFYICSKKCPQWVFVDIQLTCGLCGVCDKKVFLITIRYDKNTNKQ